MKQYILFIAMVAITGSSCEKPKVADRSCRPAFGLRFYLEPNDQCYSVDAQGKRTDVDRASCYNCQ